MSSRSSSKTRLILVAVLVAAIVAGLAVAVVSRGGPPTSIGGPLPVRAGTAPAPAWKVADSVRYLSPMAVALDPHGHTFAIVADPVTETHEGEWELERITGRHVHRVRMQSRFHGEVQDAALGVDDHDRAIVVWTSESGGLFADVDGHVSRVAAGEDLLGHGTDAERSLAVAPDGSAVVAWQGLKGGDLRTSMAVRRPGRRTFDGPRLLGTGLEPPMALADRRGGLTVIWNGNDTLSAITRPPGAAFGAAQTVAHGEIFDIGAAVGHDGRAVAVWAAGGAVHAVQRPAGATTFDAPTTLFSSSDVASQARVAIDDRGVATIVWDQAVGNVDAPSGSATVAEVQWPPDAKPGSPHRVSDDFRRHQFSPQVLSTRAGPVVTYASSDDGAGVHRPLVAIAADGRPAPLVGSFIEPNLASAPGGVVAVWRALDDGHLMIARLG